MSASVSGRAAQLARFCIVGLICFIANIAALAFFCELAGMHYVWGYILAFCSGNVLGYWLNKRFTFALRTRLDRAALVRYVLVNCVLLALSTAALHLLVESLHVWYLAASMLIAVINAPASFVAHRVLTYRIAN